MITATVGRKAATRNEIINVETLRSHSLYKVLLSLPTLQALQVCFVIGALRVVLYSSCT